MNAYNRLTELIEYMCNEQFQATIPNLAKAMGIYKEQVEADIKYLMEFEYPKGNLFFKPHISISQTDNEICYHIDSTVFFGGEKMFFPTSSQLMLYDYIMDNDLSEFEVKRDDYIYDFLDISVTIIDNEKEYEYDFDAKKLLYVKSVINNGGSLNNYENKATITPHFIRRDVNKGLFYVVQAYDDGYISAVPLYKIERNTDFAQTQEKNIIPDEIKARVDSVWSFDDETLDDVTDHEPVHIRLMIFEDNADIIEDIIMYTHDRVRGKLTGPYPYEEDNALIDVYYYEDDVLGIDAFKEWVKRFGESVVVLEPKELADKIYQEMLQPDEN